MLNSYAYKRLWGEKLAGYRHKIVIAFLHIALLLFLECSRSLKNVMLWAVVGSPVWLLMCVSERAVPDSTHQESSCLEKPNA